ncbi:fragile x mental retardation syndrome-related [Lynx pardinus]|uniref:Fragile x mental retardation syndrome-related n=1 Tax=Lynx pardinus TaxID=191816 RepID=A0A485N476_LYNPA|nr:fragile x mental retardation syndrome-related [Lynx pardinus]
MNSYDRWVLGLREEEAEVVGALITPPVMVQTLSCLAPLKQNLSVKTGRAIGHWQEKMIERADISVTGGDAQEEEGEVFRGSSSVLKDPDGNPFSLLDNTESDETAHTDASESHHSTNRRRRSRRRRTDEDALLMDGMTESDTNSVKEDGLVTVADYFSRAASQSRQRNVPRETLAKNKKEVARDVTEERGPSEKAINGPTTASGDDISKLRRTPGEEKINTLKEGNTQEAAVLNGVSQTEEVPTFQFFHITFYNSAWTSWPKTDYGSPVFTSHFQFLHLEPRKGRDPEEITR